MTAAAPETMCPERRALGPADRGLVLPPAGHFMQRGDPWQGPHAQIRRRHKVEIQGETLT